MNFLSHNKNHLTLIYNGKSALSKRAKSYAVAAKKTLLDIDISKQKISQTAWAEIADEFDSSLNSFIDLKAISLDPKADYSEHDLMKILERNPDVLSFPILIHDDKIAQIKHEADLLKYFDVDSGGFEKTFHTEPVKTDKTTDKERFTR